MNAQQETQFETCFEKFMAKQPDDFGYVARDEHDQWSLVAFIPTLKKFTALYIDKHNGGVPSVSAFEITLKLLVETGELRKVKSEPEIPAEVAEFIQKVKRNEVSSYDLKKRYRNDPAFRSAWDAQESVITPQPITLTIADYRSMPSAVLQKKYEQDKPPGFRAAVDALHASGQV